MTPDVGLVACATERDPHVGTSHRPRDGLGDRGLPNARRADEEQDMAFGLLIVLVARRGRPPPLLAQLTHRQELQHLILHVLQPVVILLEDFSGALEVERLLGPLVPRQLGHGLQIRPDDLRFHRIPVCALEARQLAIHFLAGRLRQLDRLKPLTQLLNLRRFAFLAELLADGLQLLPQQHLALALAQLLLHL